MRAAIHIPHTSDVDELYLQSHTIYRLPYACWHFKLLANEIRIIGTKFCSNLSFSLYFIFLRSPRLAFARQMDAFFIWPRSPAINYANVLLHYLFENQHVSADRVVQHYHYYALVLVSCVHWASHRWKKEKKNTPKKDRNEIGKPAPPYNVPATSQCLRLCACAVWSIS